MELTQIQKQEIFRSVLNNLVSLQRVDAEALRLLVHHKVPCNKAVENDTTMIPSEVYGGDSIQLGLMGVINGLIEPITGRRIAVHLSDADGQQVLGFSEYHPGVRYD